MLVLPCLVASEIITLLTCVKLLLSGRKRWLVLMLLSNLFGVSLLACVPVFETPKRTGTGANRPSKHWYTSGPPRRKTILPPTWRQSRRRLDKRKTSTSTGQTVPSLPESYMPCVFTKTGLSRTSIYHTPPSWLKSRLLVDHIQRKALPKNRW